MSVIGLEFSGPLLLAMPVAAAAGALTFLSPCVLPLVPGYLSYITGLSGASVASGDGERREPAEAGPAVIAARPATTTAVAVAVGTRTTAAVAPGPGRRRAVAGALLFVLGFSVLFALYGAAFGGLGLLLARHQLGLTQILGGVLIVLGLLFAGAFDRFTFAGRIAKPSMRPKAGLAGAPLLGVLFGLGWTPCSGPTLSAVLTLGETTGTAARGAVLAFVYALGVGIPFLVVAFAVERGVAMFGFARRHARLIARIGGLLLIAVGLLEVTGAWSSAVIWLKTHWISGYNSPL